MSQLSETTVVVASDEVLAAEFATEFVLLDPRDGVYYGLADVGKRIWTLLQTPVAIRTVCDAVVREYDVDAGRCLDDVRTLVRELADRGLVKVR